MVDDDGKFRISKTIPLSLIMILFLQFLGGVVVIVRMDERLTYVEQNQDYLKQLYVEVRDETEVNTQVAKTNRVIIERIDRSLERIADALEIHEREHNRDGLP